MRRSIVTVLVSTVALTAQAQTASVTGRVVSDATGDPIPNVRVALGTSTSTSPVLTDGDGRFVLVAPAGRQSVIASKSGYARSEPIAASAGQPIEIRLRRGATISGRVVDRFGEAVAAARVAAQTTAANRANPTNVATVETDDRGEYRIAGLSAGKFLVVVNTVNGTTTTRVAGDRTLFQTGPSVARTYYPGVATADAAELLQVQFGEERSDIDFTIEDDHTLGNPFSIRRLVSPIPPSLPQGTLTTAVVRGRVLSTDGRALPHADVNLIPNRSALLTRRGATDADGAFEFTELPAGKYRVIASKAGFAPMAPMEPGTGFAALFEGGRELELADGQTYEKADVTLRRWGTLAGRISDELGEPLQGVNVQLLHIRYEAGRRRLVPAEGHAPVTDDLGRYRLYALPPGQYIVSAAIGDVASGDLPGYTRSYYPGTSDMANAQFVSVGVSQDVVGIDFSLSRAKTARVTGKMLNAAGEPTQGGNVRLLPARHSAVVTSVPIGARISPDGEFEFANVAPGQYIVVVDRGRRNSWTEGEFASMPVAVIGDDVKDLVIQTSSGSSIKGRVTFDSYNNTKLPRQSALEITPIPVDYDLSPAAPASAHIHDDWSFDIIGVNGPRRLQVPRVPAGWALREIRVNRIDATDRPIAFGRRDQSLTDVEVLLSDRVSELVGTITDDNARPVRGAHVIVFPTNRDRWYPGSRYLRTTATDAEGLFAVTGLPFGIYYAAAVARLPAEGADAWQDPAYLEALVARGRTFTIGGDGDRVAVTLRLSAR
jgi:protocatechuate 3,4-dioxygenase beta subunit